MALSAFDDKSRPPEPAELKAVLGKSALLWDQLISHIATKYAPVTELWNYSGAKYGWSLRLKRKDRVVLYMTPQAGCFLVGIVLGDKAAQAAHRSGLSDSVLALIDNAPRYAEGRGIRLSVAHRNELLPVQQLAAVKMG